MPQRDRECPKCGANVFASKDACVKCGAETSSGGGLGVKLSLAGGESSERASAEVARPCPMDVEPSSSANDKCFGEVSEARPSEEATSEELPVLGKTYTWKGKTYRARAKGASKEVNVTHSLDDIMEYSKHFPPWRCQFGRKVFHETPYESIDDFVNTLRQAATGADAAFLWPSERLAVMRSIATALHHLPTGCMISIKNARAIPKIYFDKHDKLKCNVLDLYHGTSPMSLPDIMSAGLKPTLGAGCDALEAHYGIAVPGVYLAKSWSIASTYPIDPTTGRITESKSGISGGTRVAVDGSPPMRAVVRCMANTSRTLWRRGSNQSVFKPEDLFITHVFLYAVHDRLVHKLHRDISLSSFLVREDEALPEVVETSTFEAAPPRLLFRLSGDVHFIGDGTFKRKPPSMRLLYASVTPSEAQLARTGRKSLYHQWLRKRLPRTRIGYFSDTGEVQRISPAFERFMGSEAFPVPKDRTSTLIMRIAVDISYDYVPGQRETPLELTNERSVTVAQALLRGTMPSDRFPLARKAPGESTEQVFANASPPSATPIGQSNSPDSTGQARKRAKRMRQNEARDPAEQK